MKNYYLTDRTDRRELDIDLFIETVCRQFGQEKDKVLSIDRKGENINIRKILIHFIQKRALVRGIPLTLGRTASFFRGETKVRKGGRVVVEHKENKPKNHATIINACNRHLELREVGDLDYNYLYLQVEEIFNRLTNFIQGEEKEMMLLIEHFFTTSKMIKLGRFIGVHYLHNDRLQELLSKERQMELLSAELENSTSDEEKF